MVVERDDAIAGLGLIVEVVNRVGLVEDAPEQWRVIGLQSSERQPSLLGFARAFVSHLEDNPTLGETLRWIVLRHVVRSHEQIAYSKLPDFTFRFRWESGRLRFYNIGRGRFDLADMRRAAMAQLSEDMGLWERRNGLARTTTVGRDFEAEVFG